MGVCIYKCKFCYFTSVKKFNVDRHQNSKHKELNIINKNNTIEPKKAEDSNEIVEVSQTNVNQPVSIQQVKNSEINANNHNTTTINSNNNTTNNNVVNNNIIITFDRHSKETTKFISDHIDVDELKKLLNDSMVDDKNSIQMLLSDYFRQLYNNEENRCIAKSNIKLDISKVHVGNGIWDSVTDNLIFNKLLKDLSSNLKDILDENDEEIRRNFKRNLLSQFVNLYGLIDTYSYDLDETDEKELIKTMKNTIKNIKCVIVDYTGNKRNQK